MNHLTVGKDKSSILNLLLDSHHRPRRFLLVDDGEMIDALTFPKTWDVTHFDVTKHHFNPLKDIDPRRARNLANAIYSAYPQGENTLTVRNGRRALAKLLLSHTRLNQIKGNKRDPAIAEALGVLDDILFSPDLKDILCKPLNFSADGVVLLRLNRAEFGEFESFVLANLFIAQYPHTVVIPDFGFYSQPGHSTLIRQNRLIAGVNFLDEVPEKMRNSLLLIEDKQGHHCTAKDAEVLADYSGYAAHTKGWTTAIELAIN